MAKVFRNWVAPVPAVKPEPVVVAEEPAEPKAKRKPAKKQPAKKA